jgi:hypothetical protein
MTTLPPAHNVVRQELHWSVGGDLSCLTRMFFKYTGSAPNGGTLQAAAEAMGLEATAHLKGLHSSFVHLLSIRLVDLGSVTGATGEKPAYGAGSKTGQELPAQVCVLANYHIAHRYRGGKPRNYFPFGVNQDLETPQLWNASTVTSTQTALAAFIGGCIKSYGTEFVISEQVNVSYQEKGTWHINSETGQPHYTPKYKEPPEVSPITGLAISSIPATQRRRMGR